MNGFILILTIGILVRLCACCWGSSSTNIGVSTPDPKILIGNQLVINCTLFGTTINYNKNQYTVDSSMISFKFKNDYYPRDKITIINETEAQLSVKNATIDDKGMYYCLLNISGVDHNPLVCVSEVKVGYKPQPVKDFKCKSDFRWLNCTWIPRFNPIETSYTLSERMHPQCGYSTAENSCKWARITYPPYNITAKNFTFLLIGENQFGRYEQLYPIDHYSIIKPNAPRNLIPVNVTEYSITLTWSPPSDIDIVEEVLERILYEIHLVIIYPIGKNNFLYEPIIIDGIRNSTYCLNGLIPNTNYNISIRCKTIDALSDEFWSDYESVIVTTDSTEDSPSNLNIINVNHDSVYLSWFSPRKPNGIIKYYEILINDKIHKLYANQCSNECSYNITGIRIDKLYEIQVRACVDASLCSQYTSQLIPHEWQTQRIEIINSTHPIIENGPISYQLKLESTDNETESAVYNVSVGTTIGLTLLIISLVLYGLSRYMNTKMDEIKKWNLTLPPGLEAPNLGIKDEFSEQTDFNETPFIRTDSNAEVSAEEFFNSSKHRHDSEETNESKNTMEGNSQNTIPIFLHTTIGKIGHGIVSSNLSNGETHVSSDSGAVLDPNRTSVAFNDPHKHNTNVIRPLLSIVDKKYSNSSGSRDSGWNEEMSSSGNTDRKTRRRNNVYANLSQLHTKFDVRNPIYNSLVANSEPSLLDLAIKEDDNILNLSKYNKPEMAKSLSNVFQNSGPHSTANCQVFDTDNNSNRSSTRTTSPKNPYSKYGVRVPYKNNSVISDFKNLSPNKKIETNASNYVTIDMMNGYGASNSLSPTKTRLARHKEWSQSSYDAEVSSTSSNGENEQTELINQPVLYSNTSGTFSDGKNIQNKSLFDLNHESKSFISPVIAPPLPSLHSQSYDICENLFNPLVTLSDELKPNMRIDLKSKGIPNQAFLKKNNGYVSHDYLNQKSANNLIKAKPYIVKN